MRNNYWQILILGLSVASNNPPHERHGQWYVFLSARNLSAADIHLQICEVYTATAMYTGKMHKWVRDFKTGRDSFGWKVLDNSPYSLDLTPSDFHLFSYFKFHFSGKYCNDKDVVKTVLTSWLLEKQVSFFEEDTQNPVVRYEMSLNKHGSYVEK